MTIAAGITSFSVSTTNPINGRPNTFIFSINTRIQIINGDYFEFTVPDEIGLPNDSEDLIITPVERETTTDVFVQDTLSVVLSGRKLIVTFLNVVGSQTGTYSFTIDGMSNPPSEMETSPFGGLISYDISGLLVQ